MECNSSGKGKVPVCSREAASVGGGSSDTYVVTTGGRRIKLKGAIEDTWSHGTPSGTNGFKCGYCSVGQKSGGKTRLTEHLCGLSGNVQPCSHVPPNVKTILLNQVALKQRKKRDIKENRLYIEKALIEHDYRTTLAGLDEEAQYEMAMQNSLMDIGSTPKSRASGSGTCQTANPSRSSGFSNLGKASSSGSKSVTLGKASGSGKGAAASTTQSSLRSFYQKPSSSKAPFDIDLARSKATLQPRIDIMLSGDSAHKLGKTWSKWFHANDIAGRKADCPYFRSAVRLTQQLGDVSIPKGKDIDGPLLDENFNDLKAHMESFKEDWHHFGVTVMSDSWTSNNMMCIINFMIFCNGRMFFHKTVNATGQVQNANFLYGCISKVVEEEIGSKYVVQIVTDNGSNYKKACKMLVAKHQHITWQPCGAHTINLMLKDIGRFHEVDQVVKSAKRICNFLYNHNRLHAMMRQKIGGELVRWNATRFGTVFLCLQSFFDRQDEFKAWMVSPEWKNSEWRNDPDHEFAYDCLTSRVWWENMELVLKVVGPLFCVLRYADQEKNGTISGFLPKMLQAYNEITGKLKKIKHGKGLYQKVAEVISKRTRYLLNGTLIHAAAALDPQELYRSNLAKKPSSQFAVTMAIKKLAKSTSEAASAIDQFSCFIDKRGLFGTPEARWSALNGRTSAAEWWGSYGGQFPELQKIARCIVSQCVSSSGCERNWSTFALVHTKVRNRLGYDKLQKLVYVHYNLKLCIKQYEADFENFKEKDHDPCTMMMDLALYDEGNPIMEWLDNSMSESAPPILDEYDDSDDDWSTPSNFVIETIQMDAEEVAAFKRKMQLGKKKKRKMQLDEDDECIADDYDTDSPEEHGSPVYAESGDSSSNDEDGDNDVGDGSGGTTAGADVPGGSGVNHGESTPLRPRSTRKRKPNVKSIYGL